MIGLVAQLALSQAAETEPTSFLEFAKNKMYPWNRFQMLAKTVSWLLGLVSPQN